MGMVTEQETTMKGEEELFCMYCGEKMPKQAETNGFSIICPHCEAML